MYFSPPLVAIGCAEVILWRGGLCTIRYVIWKEGVVMTAITERERTMLLLTHIRFAGEWGKNMKRVDPTLFIRDRKEVKK
jgi:hypothetical protein